MTILELAIAKVLDATPAQAKAAADDLRTIAQAARRDPVRLAKDILREWLEPKETR